MSMTISNIPYKGLGIAATNGRYEDSYYYKHNKAQYDKAVRNIRNARNCY